MTDSRLSKASFSDPLIITTPNANYLPNINLGQQVIVSRLDTRYGPEDWARWPQWYFEDYNHFPYILRRPSKEDMPVHPLRRLWWDMTQEDFIEEPGCEGAGRLRDSITQEFNELLSMLRAEIAAEDWSNSPDYHRQLLKAAAEMRYAISSFQYTLQPFTNVLFTVTITQRCYLETRAILDKVRKFDRFLDGTKHEVDLSIMGTVTDRDSLVHELFCKGVPVWFVRTASSIPKTINITRQDYVIDPGPSLGVILKRWPNAPILYAGPRYSGMYLAAIRWRPGVLDLSKIESESSPLPVQEEVQAGSSSGSRNAQKPCSSGSLSLSRTLIEKSIS